MASHQFQFKLLAKDLGILRLQASVAQNEKFEGCQLSVIWTCRHMPLALF
jgi:hypothetical protein